MTSLDHLGEPVVCCYDSVVNELVVNEHCSTQLRPTSPREIHSKSFRSSFGLKKIGGKFHQKPFHS